MKYFCLILLSVGLFSGCSSTEMSAGWYAAEGVAYATYDRYKKSDDVVLIKGVDGNPNRLVMRRGWNKLWGPSENLKSYSELGFWEYTENQRRIQIYENVGVAKYGKYDFLMSTNVAKQWIAFQKNMEEKYPTQTDYIMYEHLLRKQAKINEATSEYKQEKYMFKHRND